MPEDRKTPSHCLPQIGFTLLELLVTVTVIAALASLALPAWGLLAKSGARRTATTTVMEALERARSQAITTKRDVWVLFSHEIADGGADAIRLLAKEAGLFLPLGPWIKLPPAISFREGSGTLMDERPPEDVLKAAFAGVSQSEGCTVGALMFRRNGGIGIPPQGGNSLNITLGPSKGSDATISLARATGRASLEFP